MRFEEAIAPDFTRHKAVRDQHRLSDVAVLQNLWEKAKRPGVEKLVINPATLADEMGADRETTAGLLLVTAAHHKILKIVTRYDHLRFIIDPDKFRESCRWC